MEAMPKLGKIWLHYEVHPKTRVRLDTMNPGSIVDKFFSDALVEHGVIEDDNYHFVVFNSFSFGSVDKDNPHVLVTIIELEESEDMKLSMTAELSTDDLKEAAAAWVSEQTGQTATAEDIVLSADVTATATLGDAPEAEAKPKTKRRTKAQIAADKAAEQAKEEAAADVESIVPDSSDSDAAGSGEPGEAETPAAEESSETETEVNEDPSGSDGDGEPEPVKKSKNLFADKSDGSSKDTKPASAETEAGDTETVKTPAKKKSSIFDQ